jgi:hypothetical protein
MIRPTVILLTLSLLAALKLPFGCGGDKREKHRPAEVGSSQAKSREAATAAAKNEALQAAITAAAASAPPVLPETGPEVRITSPLRGETLESRDIGVFLAVKDLPTAQGAHLHVMLDDLPPEDLPDARLPAVFRQIGPGLHVVRAFACDAHHVSFKNRTAFGITWFTLIGAAPATNMVFDPALPTLTFNLPLTSHRKDEAKKLFADFLVTGPVQHGQWRVRVTVDAERRFRLDRVDPAALLNLGGGEHSVRLELLDADDRLMKANFAWSERTVRVR